MKNYARCQHGWDGAAGQWLCRKCHPENTKKKWAILIAWIAIVCVATWTIHGDSAHAASGGLGSGGFTGPSSGSGLSVVAPSGIFGYVIANGCPPGVTCAAQKAATIGGRGNDASLWLGATAGDTNYSIDGDGTDTYFNAPGSSGHVYFGVHGGSYNMNWDGAILTVTGKIAPSNGGTCTLDAASPSKCTASVTAGAHCSCSVVGTGAPSACGVNLVTTTLTCYSANGLGAAVNYWCDK